jgi:hypothetical protein
MQRKSSYIPQTRPAEPEAKITLDRDELFDLKIVKQAMIKSAIEGGQIRKKSNSVGLPLETDEEFLERWIQYIYRNTERDKKLTESPPF